MTVAPVRFSNLYGCHSQLASVCTMLLMHQNRIIMVSLASHNNFVRVRMDLNRLNRHWNPGPEKPREKMFSRSNSRHQGNLFLLLSVNGL